MKSIKPGRGPSMMGGVVGIIMICFGIVWTAVAASYSGIMAIFGVLWTCVAVIITVFNFSNATCTRRTLTAALAGEYAISAKYAVGIDVTYRHENYASGVIGNGIEAAISFIF